MQKQLIQARTKILLLFILLLNVQMINASSGLDLTQSKDTHTFYGMAAYYNNTDSYIINKNKMAKVEDNTTITLQKQQWFASVGRLQVLLLKEEGLFIDTAHNVQDIDANISYIQIVNKDKLFSIAPELDQLRYCQLWAPLSWLAKVIESILIFLHLHITSSWGLVIIIFAVLLKLLLLPISIMTTNSQRKVSKIQAILAPKLEKIKQNYDGEEAHILLMDTYKEVGVSPFYTLKPMLGSFIQIPILIATFNALGEMPQFIGESFLWIKDLAYPDAIMYLPFSTPMFGDTLNLLPFIMTAVTIYSTIVFQNKYASIIEVKRQKRNLYLMALVFFVLFYPFPASMVFYWTLSNLLHLIQQKYIKI